MFAERRLERLPRNISTAEDVVQSALQTILVGTRKSHGGRHPRLDQIQSKKAFLHYLRSAINSVIDSTQRRRELFHIHESIQSISNNSEKNDVSIVLIAAIEPDADDSWVDFKKEFFKECVPGHPCDCSRPLMNGKGFSFGPATCPCEERIALRGKSVRSLSAY